MGNKPARAFAPRRLVCIVEGQGEVEAVPSLCARIFALFQASGWIVDPNPIKQPRSLLVDESAPSPHRGANLNGLGKAVELAKYRPADAALVMCDADDDCAATWGPSAEKLVLGRLAGGAVMPVREFEAWLLIGFAGGPKHGPRTIETIRDAKGAVSSFSPNYKPTQDQLRLTRGIDINTVWTWSDSFDKLLRTLSRIAGFPLPARPIPPLLK